MSQHITLSPDQLDEIVARVTRGVVEALSSRHFDEPVSMREAAKILGLSITKESSLRTTFTKFANPRHYEKPLKAYYIGRERMFKKHELIEFMENRTRN